MASSTLSARDRPVEFSVGELTGAIGDSVTVLPLVVAAAALSDLSLPVVLLGFAVFQVVWGLHYRLPVSVEPMKALAALVVAGALTAGGLAVAGLLAGAALLVGGRLGLLARLDRAVGRPAVRGVQLAVALLLLETGLRVSLAGPGLAAVGVLVALAMAALGRRSMAALVILGVGVAVALFRTGIPAPALPAPELAPLAMSSSVLGGALSQLAMTVGNAAVAASLLLSEYFDADVGPDDLATSMGAMNLVAAPLGGMPMCHGSGGIAGKYAFGARTAGANLLLGGLYALAAVVGAGVVAAFPLPVLGVALALVALELGRTALAADGRALVVGVGLLGVLTNVGLAFVAGALAHAALARTS